MKESVELIEIPKWLGRARQFFDMHSFGAAAVAAVMVVAAGVGFTVWQWEWLHGSSPENTASTTMRNMGLLVAGGLAIVFAAWRGWVAERQSATARRQAETSQEQADTAYRGLLNERYQRGAEMLGSEVLTVRMAGIYALQRLAEEHPEQYHIQVMQLLCAFVRSPLGDNDTHSLHSERIVSLEQATREDVRAIVMVLRNRKERGLNLESDAEFRLDLRGANLIGCDLSEMNLSNAILGGVDFAHADLTGTNFSGADLRRAGLFKSRLGNADFSRATIYRANFSESLANQANFSSTSISRANFSRACLSETNFSFSMIKDSEMKDAALMGADLSFTTFFIDENELAAQSQKCGITQAQLDAACSDPLYPPQLNGLLDAETHEPLVWRGRSIEA